MTRRQPSLRRSPVILAATAAAAAASLAAFVAGPRRAAAEEKEGFKNVQVLKGLSPQKLDQAMEFMSAALGARCGTCHVKTGDKWEWDKDDKPVKKTARRMLEMTMLINKTSFGGDVEVSCWTCHQGRSEPVGVPPLPRPAAPAPPVPPTSPSPAAAAGKTPAGAVAGKSSGPGAAGKAAAPVPTVDQVLGRYVQALGGKAALSKVKTRVMKGTTELRDGRTAPLEIYEKAPGKQLVVTTTPMGARKVGTDGKGGWMAFPGRPVREIAGEDFADMKREADFQRALHVKDELPGLKVAGRETVGEREVVVLRAQAGGRDVRLSFDAGSGLLVRRLELTETVVGAIPEQADFEDYRDVRGVKEPFVVRVSSIEGTQARRFTSVEHDVAVDDAMFARPAGEPPAPGPR